MVASYPGHWNRNYNYSLPIKQFLHKFGPVFGGFTFKKQSVEELFLSIQKKKREMGNACTSLQYFFLF